MASSSPDFSKIQEKKEGLIRFFLKLRPQSEFSPQIDRIFPTATLKQYLMSQGLGFLAEILSVRDRIKGLGFRVNLVFRVYCLRFRVWGFQKTIFSRLWGLGFAGTSLFLTLVT